MAPRAAAAVAAAAASPVGLALSKTHEIGSLISKGQFGEVYAVEGGGEKKRSWVVKVVPLPTKTTRKQTSAAEIAYRRLNYEYLAYTNCRTWSGSLLPLLPSKVTDKIAVMKLCRSHSLLLSWS
jgi:dTDP-D-glucose 4,6-dehydratase